MITFYRYLLLRISQLMVIMLLAITNTYAVQEQISRSPHHSDTEELSVDFDLIDCEISSSNNSTTYTSENSTLTSPLLEEDNTVYDPKISKPVDKKKSQPSIYNNVIYKKPADKKRTQSSSYNKNSSYNNVNKMPASKKREYYNSDNDEECNCPVVNTNPQPSYFSKTENRLRAATLEKYRFSKSPMIAVKTNLLFDVATTLNVEIEAPIGKRFSIAGEYMFPWWLLEDNQYCLQIISGSLEGRYWLGDRRSKERMTGWFAGLYAGGGYYDIEWGDKGYQGEFFIASGVSGGYAHTISKSGNWRMEYSLGIGYLQTKYREYTPKRGIDDEWHLIHQANGKQSWFGPTKAKISLVWVIDFGFLKKGGSR